jgi:hypothetical protein
MLGSRSLYAPLEDIRQAQTPKTTRKRKLQVEPSKCFLLDFVEVRFQVKKSDKYYLGQVLGIEDDPDCDEGVFRVNFMRPNRKIRFSP